MHLRRVATAVLAILALGCATGGIASASPEARSPRATSAVAFDGWQQISAGGAHTCGRTIAGRVFCWGNNVLAQLATDRVWGSAVPVPVIALSMGASTVSAGRAASCAVTTAGAVFCWGVGLLLEGEPFVLAPYPAGGLTSGIASVSVGSGHACAVSRTGGVSCWGSNEHGQLGNAEAGEAAEADSAVAVPVHGLGSGVAAVSAGGGHTCAVTAGGAAWCWGSNSSGQLGTGTTRDSGVPVPVRGLEQGVAAIRAGEHHTCAVGTDATTWCWGRNSSGQLGNGSTADLAVPTPVDALAGRTASVSVGPRRSCAVTTDGAVLCWGSNDDVGLGDGQAEPSMVPVTVYAAGSGIREVSAGYGHTCVVSTVGDGRCWGGNESLGSGGQLGDGSTLSSRVPVPIAAPGTTLPCAVSAVAPASVRRGQQVEVTGTITSAAPATTVRLQRRDGGRWHTVVTGPTGPGYDTDQIEYELKDRPTTGTVARYRVVAPATAVSRVGVSRTVMVRLT